MFQDKNGQNAAASIVVSLSLTHENPGKNVFDFQI